MATKRMRVFAGPNGSGKTTIINNLPSKIPSGVYVNADDIQRTLKTERSIHFDEFEIQPSTEDVQDFFKHSQFAPAKLNNPNLWQCFSVTNNKLLLLNDVEIDAYMAADIAEFIRQCLLKAGRSFSYETVMSHTGKLSFMQAAKAAGYRIYLYFVATEDPEINISRVTIRVAQEGHAVGEDKIRSRYYRSLENLRSAVKLADRAYIFDNSGSAGELLAEITNGIDVEIIDNTDLPQWFFTYLVDGNMPGNGIILKNS
jgi:predicted ABC-type ATPase